MRKKGDSSGVRFGGVCCVMMIDFMEFPNAVMTVLWYFRERNSPTQTRCYKMGWLYPARPSESISNNSYESNLEICNLTAHSDLKFTPQTHLHFGYHTFSNASQTFPIIFRGTAVLLLCGWIKKNIITYIFVNTIITYCPVRTPHRI